MAIKIITDSTCDLPKSTIDKHGIVVVPLTVLLGDKAYSDGDIKTTEMFKWVEENKTLPTTSAPNIGQVIDVIEPIVNNGDNIIAITISSELSSTFNNCVNALNLIGDNIKYAVVDSKHLSSGAGLLVIKAIELIESGLNFEAIVYALENYRDRIKTSFIVDTLEYLKMGGRCSSTSAFIGGAMKLHPILKLSDGRLVSDKKIRGSVNMAVHKYISEIAYDLEKANKEKVFITHTGFDANTIEKIREQLLDDYKFNEVIVTDACCVIASHCGPGTLGVIFVS